MVSKKSSKKSSVSKVLGNIKTPKKIKTAKTVKSKSKSGKKKGRIFGDPVVILE